MMRMFMMQGAFFLANKNKNIGKKGIIGIVVLVSLGFILKDLQDFFRQLHPNIYKQTGLSRTSTIFEIEHARDQYMACIDFD